ncbi:MAG: glycine dehydrogenase subunit 2 [Solirubrobacterales bacterium 67-14]|nr:MAG: glycine dehydrogenase subunit 2 [Solirubrobacterales bacterium 67-14]
MSGLRRYHAPVWDEPVVMEMGSPGRRGFIPPAAGDADTAGFVPDSMKRGERAGLPELSEAEVQRHYIHLAQETLGMMGVNLFGTCTIKYSPLLGERISADHIAELHPGQDPETIQGVLAVLHGMSEILCELSGMDQFVFQAGGGADAAYVNAVTTRAYHADRGELEQRNEIITTIQTHPCNAATAAAAGFKVVTLMLGEDGYPPLEALEAAVSERTAGMMIGNPDDMGIYNPEIKQWVDLVHEAGGLCFYDHANFNGAMSKLRARELGFDACMFMLHKTFAAPFGGGGPAVGAYGCSSELEPYMPRPLVREQGGSYSLEDVDEAPKSVGRVREYWGNVPQIVKAYSWVRSMGAEGIRFASDMSVLANNYMEKRLLEIPGLSISHPDIKSRRLEMTRYSLGKLQEDTGVTVFDVQNRMVDFGVDAPWLSHEPWLVPEPITPEAGETWPIEDLDYWIDVLAQVCREAYEDPEIVKTAPHNQAIGPVDGSRLDEPDQWATTWRAYKRKHGDRPKGRTSP